MKTYNLIINFKKLFILSCLITLVSCNYSNYINQITKKTEYNPIALILVPNKDRFDVLDMQTNRVTSSYDTEQRPESIATDLDEKLILISNYNSGNVSAFLRAYDNEFKKLGNIGSGSKPVGVAFNPNPNISEAYIAYQGDSKILILDTKDKTALPKIKSTFSLQGYSPKKIAVNTDGSKIYITDNLSGKLIVLKRNGDSFDKSEITLVPDLEKSTETNKLEGIIIDKPVSLKDSQNKKVDFGTGRIFIANHAQDSIIVLKDEKLEATISLRDSSILEEVKVSPRNMVIYRNAKTKLEKMYVTGYGASVISVIDLKTLKLIKNVQLSGNQSTRDIYNPVGITNGILASRQDVMFIASTSGLTLSLLDPVTDSLKRSFSTTIGALQSSYGEMINIGMEKE